MVVATAGILDAGMHSAMDFFTAAKHDVARMTSHDLMHWFIDQNLTILLDDFKDVSGAHLYQMRDAIGIWLKENKPADQFPIPVGGATGCDRKLNSLRSLGYKLLELYPLQPENSPPQIEKTRTEMSRQMRSNLNRWKLTVNILQRCHKEKAIHLQRVATILTVFVVSLNAIVSSAMFSSISDTPEHHYESTIRIIAAVLSITSGVAAAVRSALRLETIAEQHSSAARRFGKLSVRFTDLCEMMEVQYKDGTDKAAEWKDWFKDYMDVMEQAPMIADAEFDVSKARMQSKDREDPNKKTVRVVPEEEGPQSQSAEQTE